MLTNQTILHILREASFVLKHELDLHALSFVEINSRQYAVDEFLEFKRDLIEAGNTEGILFLEYGIHEIEFENFYKQDGPILAFKKKADDLVPVLIPNTKDKSRFIYPGAKESVAELNALPWLKNDSDNVILFVIFPYRNLVTEEYNKWDPNKPPGPVSRFFRLLGSERNQIAYILFYALAGGLISLVLPLGIQNTIELISGGVFFSSVYLLIAFVILGVLIAGGLQIVQVSMVEYLQRRIFTKAAFEFAYRIPRLKVEGLLNNYAPELVNRFFDIITLQKGLPKLLIDLSSSTIQIFFGLLLLSLYHPFFVFFSIFLVTVLIIIFYITGPRGLESSLMESKYKYRVVQWLEELARAINSFKLAGNTDVPIRRTDENVNNYLKYRRKHFGILIGQFSFIVLFKGLVTGGLLIMGTILVVNREITLGQFVAAEIIIILILNSVEKIILYLDVVYDLLTAVDKISHVTDLPLDRIGGIDFPSKSISTGFNIEIKNLNYKYPEREKFALRDINLNIKPGERICVCGNEGSGKTTLTSILAGLFSEYEGGISINNYSLRDLDITHLRNKIAKNISPEDIFEGTILENITIGKAGETIDEAIQAIAKVGLKDKINSLPQGLNTHIISGGKGFSSNMIQRLILARCFAKRPELLILNDFFSGLTKREKLDLINRIMDKENHCTIVAVSNDPLVMSACDRVLFMSGGRIQFDGPFEEVMKQPDVLHYFE